MSVPDDVFARAERVAARLGRTRSALYVEALRAYLDRQDEQAAEITARRDVLYGSGAEPAGDGSAAGRRLVDSGRWPW